MATAAPEARPRRAWGKPLGRQELLSSSQARSGPPSPVALEARIARGEALHVWMGTFDLSGQFVILLDADGTVREVSKIDGYVK